MNDILSLSFVIAGMVALAFVARRYLPLLGKNFRPRGSLKQLGILALTPQCSVALVQAGEETLVLGLTPHNVTLLTKAGEPIGTVAEAERSPGSNLKFIPNFLGEAADGTSRLPSAQRGEGTSFALKGTCLSARGQAGGRATHRQSG